MVARSSKTSPFSGGQVPLCCQTTKQALVVVIGDGVERQVAPGLAFAIERNAQRQGAASFGFVHAAQVANGGDKIIVKHGFGLDDDICGAQFCILLSKRRGQRLLCGDDHAQGKNSHGNGENDKRCTRAVVPQVAVDFSPAGHGETFPFMSLTITPSAMWS